MGSSSRKQQKPKNDTFLSFDVYPTAFIHRKDMNDLGIDRAYYVPREQTVVYQEPTMVSYPATEYVTQTEFVEQYAPQPEPVQPHVQQVFIPAPIMQQPVIQQQVIAQPMIAQPMFLAPPPVVQQPMPRSILRQPKSQIVYPNTLPARTAYTSYPLSATSRPLQATLTMNKFYRSHSRRHNFHTKSQMYLPQLPNYSNSTPHTRHQYALTQPLDESCRSMPMRRYHKLPNNVEIIEDIIPLAPLPQPMYQHQQYQPKLTTPKFLFNKFKNRKFLLVNPKYKTKKNAKENASAIMSTSGTNLNKTSSTRFSKSVTLVESNKSFESISKTQTLSEESRL